MLSAPDVEHVLRLAERAPSPPDEVLVGASAAALEGFEARTGLRLSADFRHWLLAVNGATLGPGGLFGVRDARDFLSIEGILKIYPDWVDRGWIPIAADGVGNYWVTAMGPDSTDGWVAFVDTHQDPEVLQSYVASSVLHFLSFLLTAELGEPGWPAHRDHVVALDAAMAGVPDELAPWR